jgi:hypothetical protein
MGRLPCEPQSFLSRSLPGSILLSQRWLVLYVPGGFKRAATTWVYLAVTSSNTIADTLKPGLAAGKA